MAIIRARSRALSVWARPSAALFVFSLCLSTCSRDVTAPSLPAQLAFTVQPPATAAGHQIAPAVQVTAQDALGHPVPAFAGSVTVAITAGTGTGGAALSGTTTVAAVNGVATFSTLSLDKSGTGYTLSATASGLTGAPSAAFAITAGSATQLAFTTQPSAATGGVTITPVVQVAAQDALGNVVTGFTGSVTVGITAGTGPDGATLAGVTTVAAAGGFAVFPNLSIDKTGTVEKGTGYTLSATATCFAGAISDPFDIKAGHATQLVFTVQPTTKTAGAHVAPPVQVAALDAVGNAVPAFSGNVTVAIGTNPAGGTLFGSTTVAAVGGVATFSTLSLDKRGTGYALSASATGLSGATSAAFAVTPGPATQLEFTVQPGMTTVQGTIHPAVRVTARDALGNSATGFQGNVTVAIGTNPTGATLSGTTTLAAIGGVATFSSLSIDHVGSYTLSATAAGLAGAASAPFDIVPSIPIRLVFTAQPSTWTAGVTVTPAIQVTAQDASGNAVPAFTGDVTLAIGANPAGGSLSDTTTLAAVGGVATFSDISVDRSGSGYTLTAAATGLTGATSAPFAVVPGAAARLVFAVQPSTATARATITPEVEVTALDGFGNTATGFTGNVTVAIGTNPAGGVLSGTPTVPTVAGVAAFLTLSIDKPDSGYTLLATATGPTGATSAPFDITAAPAARLVFTPPPTDTTAGATMRPVQLTAKDALGNTVTGFTGNVTLTITAGTGASGARLVGATTVAAVGGVATFSALSIAQSASGYTLSATGTGLAGTTSSPFTITAGLATQLVFTAQPSDATAGATITPAVRVTARDARGNAVPGFTGSVTVAIGTNPAGGTLSGTTTLAAVGGVATFSNLSVDKSASGYTLSATASGLTAATSAPFTVLAGAATRLAFTVQPGAATAGATFAPAIRVAALDGGDNAVPGFTGTVTVAIVTNPAGGTLTGATTVAAVAGVATFSTLSLDKSGTGYTLSAAAAGLAGATSAAFAITPGSATHLVFTVQPATATAGGTIKPAVRVTARDALGNTATGFVGNVTVGIGTNPAGGTLSGTRTFAAIAGVATFPSLNIDKVGRGYTLSASAVAAGLTGATSAPFDVIASTATQLLFTVQPADSQTAGAVIGPALQVTAQDASDKQVTTFAGNVTLAIEPGTGISGATLSGSTTVAAVGGVATFSDLRIDKSEAWYTLVATAPGLAAAGTSFRVFAGAATALVFRVQPSTATVGATITPPMEVTARDGLGNTATGFTGDMTLAIGTNPAGGILSGTPTLAAVAGVATFRNLSIGRAGGGYTLSAEAAGLARATSAPFDITAARASQLVFTVQPTSTTAGVKIGR